jgi:hypothetical protein
MDEVDQTYVRYMTGYFGMIVSSQDAEYICSQINNSLMELSKLSSIILTDTQPDFSFSLNGMSAHD